jgi:hypothetical protein
LCPSSWSGSLATKLEERFRLLDQVDTEMRPALAEPLEEAKAKFRRRIESERYRENLEAKQQNARFE